MASKITRLRIAGASGALIGAGALAVALAAPASAAVTGVSIVTPSGYAGSSNTYGTGCKYDVSATYANASDGPVTFTATDASGKETKFGTVTPDPKSTSNKVSATWTPTAKGSYTIAAKQDGSDPATASAKVGGRGIQTPAISQINSSLTSGTCIVLPF